MRYFFLRIVICIAVSSVFSCSNVHKPSENKKAGDSIKSVEFVDFVIESDSITEGKSLNDIRFANFTDKDWLDNEYIRTLRRYLDEFNNGIIEDEELEKYKDDVKGEFVIANIEPFLLGGLFIQIVFIEKPENVFTSWVYSDVDEETERIVGYSVRRISLDERKNNLSREQILQEMKEHPEMKLW